MWKKTVGPGSLNIAGKRKILIFFDMLDFADVSRCERKQLDQVHWTELVRHVRFCWRCKSSLTINVIFADNFAGFIVKLDPYIFPAPHDRSADIIFTVVLRIICQGFDDFTNGDRNTGVLSGLTLVETTVPFFPPFFPFFFVWTVLDRTQVCLFFIV